MVLARQNRQEEACFGVTITPENDEQREAAAASPKKMVVLWPVLSADGGVQVTWGVCPQREVKDATDRVVAEHFQKMLRPMDKRQAEKTFKWCRDYVADAAPEQHAC